MTHTTTQQKAYIAATIYKAGKRTTRNVDKALGWLMLGLTVKVLDGYTKQVKEVWG